MKQRFKDYLKLGVFCLGIIFFTVTCEKDNYKADSVEAPELQITPIIRTVSYNEVEDKFRVIKEGLKLNKQSEFKFQFSTQSRAVEDTLGITVYTDVIKEIISGDYTSYTMRIVSQEENGTTFYNLTLEDINGNSSMFITKYTPTEYWLNNKGEPYQGEITTLRNHLLTDAEAIEDILEAGGNGNNGGGVYNNTDNTVYPTDCNGMVITTVTLVGVPCGCGHWPGQTCRGSTCGSPTYPYYENVTTYECIGATDNPNTGNPSDTSDNSNTGGGSTSDGSEAATSLTTIVGPKPPREECNASSLAESIVSILNLDPNGAQAAYLSNGENCENTKSISDYLVTNYNDLVAYQFAQQAIQALMDNDCVIIPSINIDNLQHDYDSNMFGDYPNPTTQQNHAAIKQQYEQQLSTNGNISAVNYLINTYSMDSFGSDSINTNYTITIVPDGTIINGDAETVSSYNSTSGVMNSSVINIENGLLQNSDFGYLTRALKHELYHVLQGQFYGYYGISSELKEFDAYFAGIYRFNNLPKINSPTKLVQLVIWLEQNWDSMTAFEKQSRQDMYDKVKGDFPEICNN